MQLKIKRTAAYGLATLVFLAHRAISGETLTASGPEPSAADDSSAEAAAVSEVVVTGSNVRGADLNPVVDVQVLDKTQILQSGARQVSDLVTEIPANTGTTLYNENGQLSGTAQFELRGLGFSSTLVLLNGRRAGVAPLSDKSGADFVDINQFPLAMVDRIEVLKDGSSAIYGSEAVAGVVNIITRRGFEGLELSSDYASSTNDAWSVNLATGHKFDSGWFNLYATYYHQTGNLRSNFPWLMERVGGNGIPGYSQLINNNGYPGTFQLATTNAAGRPMAVAGASTVADPDCQAAGGVFPLNARGVANTSTCDFNFANQIGVIPNEQRIQTFVEGGYQLTGNLEYFNETSFSRNVNDVYEQSGSYSNGAAVGGLIYIPASAPFNFFTADPNNPKNVTYVNPAQWDPAVDHAVALVGNLRPQGSYISADKKQTDTYLRIVNGLDLSLAHDWHVSASDEYAYGQYQELNPLGINATAFNNLIATGQYNPFGTAIVTPTLVSPKDGVSVAGNSASVVSQIFYTTDLTRSTEQNVADLSASGPLVRLPSGAISAALGGQYRTQKLKYVPDSLTAAGLGAASSRDAPFSGSERVIAEYAEMILPFWDVAQIQAAVRREDYGNGIGSTTNPKIAGRLGLPSGIVGLRGSWGTSFQAPTLTQASTTELLSVVNDPVVFGTSGPTCGSTAVGTGLLVTTTGGNLKPQTSENFDLGIDVKPVSSWTISGDYWHYRYTNLIAAAQNAQAVVNGECVNGVYVADPRVSRSPGGLLLGVTASYVNVGKVIAEGFDLSSTYDLSLNRFGHILFRGDATHVDHFYVFGPNGSVTDDAGSRNFNNNFAPMPQWRATARAAWSLGIHEIAVGANYTGGYRNDQDFNAPIASFTTVDAQYTLHLESLLHESKGSTALSVGVNNLSNAAPPALTRYTSAGVLITGPTAIDRPGYDALSGANIQGRILYARFVQTF